MRLKDWRNLKGVLFPSNTDLPDNTPPLPLCALRVASHLHLVPVPFILTVTWAHAISRLSRAVALLTCLIAIDLWSVRPEQSCLGREQEIRGREAKG